MSEFQEASRLGVGEGSKGGRRDGRPSALLLNLPLPARAVPSCEEPGSGKGGRGDRRKGTCLTLVQAG